MKLDDVLGSLEKDYGKGNTYQFNNFKRPSVEFISTRSLGLDKALGGGWARGRMSELYAPESVGKTTLAMLAIAEVQSKGELAAIIDMEHSFNVDYAEKLGVNVGDLIFTQPDYGEQALDIVERLLHVENMGYICVDSIASLIPKAELEGDFGDLKMGLQARMMSQAMRKLSPIVGKTRCHLQLINQYRMKLGLQFGDPRVTTGGEAMKYYASQRLELLKGTAYMDGKGDDADDIGHDIKVKIKKNKVSPPFKKALIPLIYGYGIDQRREVIDFGVAQDIIKKGGSWYSYGDVKLGQGKDAVVQLLEDNPELMQEIRGKISLD